MNNLKAPFALPVRIEDERCLVAANSFLISWLPDATTEEREYIVAALNEREKLRSALEAARNGIVWYIENSTLANGSDDEMLQQIDEALK